MVARSLSIAPQTQASRADVFAVVAYLCTIAFALAAFREGGAVAIVGVLTGALLGLKSGLAAPRGQRVFDFSFAGLWIGLMLGGLCQSSITGAFASLG